MGPKSLVEISTGRDIFKGAVCIQIRQEFDGKLLTLDEKNVDFVF